MGGGVLIWQKWEILELTCAHFRGPPTAIYNFNFKSSPDK